MIELEELRRPPRALLLCFPESLSGREVSEDIEELTRLCETMGVEPVEALALRVAETNPKYFMGTGKAEEIATLCEELEVELLVFDKDLSPSQQRNWERLTKIAVIDRQEVILQIFSDRAQTREARLQVEYAKLQYEMPRLTRAWAHLGRQRGGAKGTRGEGETQLEIDRRIIESRIARIREDLRTVEKQRETLRKSRKQAGVFTVAIVGYTNAGKSSLLRAICGAETYVADKLFATLDTSIRRVEAEDGTEFLITDTVGFVRKLPHRLIDAFKSTLEETLQADLLLHVADASNPALHSQIRTTRAVLGEIGANSIPEFLVLNKKDRLDADSDLVRFGAGSLSGTDSDGSSGARGAAETVRNTAIDDAADAPGRGPAIDDAAKQQSPGDIPVLFTSALTGEGVAKLVELVTKRARQSFASYVAHIPYARQDLAALCHREGQVEGIDYQDSGIAIRGRIPKRFISALQPFAVNGNDV